MQRRFAIPPQRPGIRARVEQGLDDGGMAAARGEQERGFAFFRGAIRIGFAGQQLADLGEVAGGGGAQ